MKRIGVFFGVACMAAAVAFGSYGHGSSIGTPVSDEAAASIVGGCNGPTTGTLGTCGAGCPGAGALAVNANGNTNAAAGAISICTLTGGGCIVAPATNPAGCAL